MMIKFFLFLHLCWLASPLFATITITRVSGVSRSEVSAESASLFGGYAGTCSSTDGENTCDSCSNIAGDALSPCNTNSIYPTLKFRIYFTSTTSGTVFMQYDETDITLTGDTGTITEGNETYVETTWATICGAATSPSDTTCETSFARKDFTFGIKGSGEDSTDSRTVQISMVKPENVFTGSGADTIDEAQVNAQDAVEGIYDYTALPGDEKIIIESVKSYPEGFPVSSNGSQLSYIYFRLLVSDSFQLGPNSTDFFFDLPIVVSSDNDEVEITPNVLEPLENGKAYFVRGSVVDEALNWIFFVSDTQVASKSTCNLSNSLESNVSSGCPYVVMPQKVFGLLEDDINCFIASAAYGSPFHSKVKDFRNFRNTVLLKTTWGKKLTQFYYIYGPYGSRVLNQYPQLKPLARIFLWPVWFAIQFPWVLLLLALFSFGFIFRSSIQKRKFLWTFFFIFLLATPFQEKDLYAQDDIQIEEDFLDEDPIPGEETSIDDLAETELNFDEEDDEEEEEENSSLDQSKRSQTSAQVFDTNLLDTSKKIEVHHPNAKKGLYRIDKERVYHYKVTESEREGTIIVRGGLPSYNQLQGNSTASPSFKDIYGSAKAFQISADREWDFQTFLGKFALRAGAGLSVASGKGVFEDKTEATESFNFLLFPLNISVVYHLHLFDNQPITPFIEGGGLLLPFLELRDDITLPKVGGSFAAHFSAGIALSFRLFAPSAVRTFDKEYGVNDVWLTAELQQRLGFGKFDFTSTHILGGMIFEY